MSSPDAERLNIQEADVPVLAQLVRLQHRNAACLGADTSDALPQGAAAQYGVQEDGQPCVSDGGSVVPAMGYRRKAWA